MSMLDRIKGILIEPRSEWTKVAVEPATVQSLYTTWIMILAAIGPLLMLVGAVAFGFVFGVRIAIVAYLNALIGVGVLAAIADLLAPTFGGSRDYVASLKLTAYSFTAVWIAEIALIVPVLGWLVLLAGAGYACYLFLLGAPVLRKCAADRAVPYTLVVLLCAIVLSYLVQQILYGVAFSGTPLGPGGMGLMR